MAADCAVRSLAGESDALGAASACADQTIPAYHKAGFTFDTDVLQGTKFRVYGSSNTAAWAGSPALTSQWVPANISLRRDDGIPFTLEKPILLRRKRG